MNTEMIKKKRPKKKRSTGRSSSMGGGLPFTGHGGMCVCAWVHVWRVSNNSSGDGEQIKGKGGRRIYSRGSFHRAADSWQHIHPKWDWKGGGNEVGGAGEKVSSFLHV